MSRTRQMLTATVVILGSTIVGVGLGTAVKSVLADPAQKQDAGVDRNTFVTCAKVEKSHRDGADHFKVTFDKGDRNWKDAPAQRYFFSDKCTIESNGIAVPWHSPAGMLLEIVSPYEAKERYAHLFNKDDTDKLDRWAYGLCILRFVGSGICDCAQGTCTGTCIRHTFPCWCECK